MNRFPLIEKRMSILDCIRWLERHEYPVPMRSQCVCCPYRTNRDWHDLKVRDPRLRARDRAGRGRLNTEVQGAIVRSLPLAKGSPESPFARCGASVREARPYIDLMTLPNGRGVIYDHLTFQDDGK